MIDAVEQHKILFVDDDEQLLCAIKSSISRMRGVDVVTARDVDEAKRCLRDQDIAVLLTDHEMPGGSGLDLLEWVMTQRLETVSILLTGHASLDLALAAINRGHVFFLLQKPCRHSELMVILRSACERFSLGRRLADKVREFQRANLELRKRNEELERARDEVRRLEGLATTDSKTGTFNYHYFIERLNAEAARALRYKHSLALCLIDLDSFKPVNDQLGHLAGDEVLFSVSSVLQTNIRVMDVLARYGGDEFALLLPDTDLQGAEILASRLCALVRNRAHHPAEPGQITLSIGVATFDRDCMKSGQGLLELADTGLLEAKRTGKDRYTVAMHDVDGSIRFGVGDEGTNFHPSGIVHI